MANVYLEEGSLENAYILYLKFMTLFLEKIRKHPDFSSVTPQEKAANQIKLREVLPKAEKLKQQLLKKYTEEYNRFLEEEVSYYCLKGMFQKYSYLLSNYQHITKFPLHFY